MSVNRLTGAYNALGKGEVDSSILSGSTSDAHQHFTISLRKADRTEAKAKCVEVAGNVERQLKAFCEGPRCRVRSWLL